MNIENYIIDSETSILDTMNLIDKNARGIAYVVDSSVLIGAISDGDVRRYILKNKTLDGCAKDVMNPHPVVIRKESVAKAKAIMVQKHINSVPIVDNLQNILYIEFLDGQSCYKKEELNIPVVIMAGGKGSRLYPFTQILPKPLIPIGEKTICEHIIESFENFGCKDFSIIVNYKKELIKAFFSEKDGLSNIQFIDEKKFMGTAGGLKLLNGSINSTFFMSNCDILIQENYVEILKYHKKMNNIITLVCALKKNIIPYGTVVADDFGCVKELTEKPVFEFLTNTGLYVIEPEFLELIPDDTFIHITDVIQICIDKGYSVGAFPISENAWMDMGQIDELKSMINELENLKS